jgi:hypothetical protein
MLPVPMIALGPFMGALIMASLGGGWLTIARSSSNKHGEP